ncbi:MAG: hypothetical protein ACYCX5_10680 [Coriobacteriia bacterium]
MSLKELPAHVRTHVIINWVGVALAGLGILGFILSFNDVAGPARWAENVHTDIPWIAYISIFMWAGGLGLAWYGRTRVKTAVRKRQEELAGAAKVNVD